MSVFAQRTTKFHASNGDSKRKTRLNLPDNPRSFHSDARSSVELSGKALSVKSQGDFEGDRVALFTILIETF